MKEFVVAGLLMSPFVRYALIAAVVMFILRFALIRLGVYRFFWHPLLAEAAIYVCLVAILNLSV